MNTSSRVSSSRPYGESVMTRRLFIATAAIEAATSVALVIAPAIVVRMLLGASLDADGDVVIARIAGAALFSLAIVCWTARSDGHSTISRGLLCALLFYNLAIVLLLMHANLGEHLAALGLWPAVGLHAAFSLWCIVNLRKPASGVPN